MHFAQLVQWMRHAIHVAVLLPLPFVAHAGLGVAVVTEIPVLQTMQEQIVITGTLHANESVQISPEIAGTIAALPFTEGGEIHKGDPILALDDSLFTAQLRQAQASYDLAKIRHDRSLKLLKKKSVSQAVYDESVAELNERKAAREVAEVKLAKTRIKAPFDGYIGFRNTSIGAYVTPGQPLFTLVDDTPLKLQFRIPERLANVVIDGTEIDFEVDSSGHPERYKALILATEPLITSSSRSLQAKAIFENDERRVRAGAFAKIILMLGADKPSLTIPSEALIGSNTGYSVFVVVDGTAERRAVTTGVRRSGLVAITSGLEKNIPVIVAGHQMIRDGASVNVVEQGSAQ
jgi:membrane fusion protein (multidrug efflux system)